MRPLCLVKYIRYTPLQGESILCLHHSHSVKYGQLLFEIERDNLFAMISLAILLYHYCGDQNTGYMRGGPQSG